jgi:hypothetical protein
MRLLGKDILATWIALIAIIANLFFVGVVHSTSVWIAAAGPAAQLEANNIASSFFEICSAGGLVSLDGEEGEGEFDPDRCPVCSAAAATFQSDTPCSPTLITGVRSSVPLWMPHNEQVIAQNSQRSTFARGPPVLS